MSFLPRAIIRSKKSSAGGSGAVRVQTSGLKSVAASTNATDTVTAGANFTAGNTVILCVSGFSDQNTTQPFSGITIGGTAAVEDSGKQHAGANLNYRVSIWRATSVAGGNPNVVFAWAGGSGPNHQLACSFEEWTGFVASPVDKVPTPVQSTGTTQSITSAATAQNNEVVYAACNTTNGDCAGLAGPTSGFTQTFVDNSGSGTAGVAGYKVVTSIGAQAAGFSTTGSVESDAVMVTYKTN